MLQDLYVNKNPWLTKSRFHAKMFFRFPTSILVEETGSETYEPKRKVLSSVFFKQKLQDMTKLIKECTIDNVRKL